MRIKLLTSLIIQLLIILLIIFASYIGQDRNSSPPSPGPTPVPVPNPNPNPIPRPGPKPSPSPIPIPAPIPDSTKSPNPTPIPPPGACDGKSAVFNWTDYASKPRTVDAWLCKEDYEKATTNRISVRGDKLYYDLVKHDLPKMQDLINKYRSLVKNDALSVTQSIETIAASVQQIPYTLVHHNSHSYWDTKGDANFIKTYHDKKRRKVSPLDQIGGCLESIEPNGVVSPLEFMWHQMGDCDSRTTFLFGILKSLELDVIMLTGPSGPGSGHALLGVNVPNPSGYKYYKFKGKKYYLLETTGFHRKQTRIGVYSNRYFSQDTWKIKLI